MHSTGTFYGTALVIDAPFICNNNEKISKFFPKQFSSNLQFRRLVVSRVPSFVQPSRIFSLLNERTIQTSDWLQRLEAFLSVHHSVKGQSYKSEASIYIFFYSIKLKVSRSTEGRAKKRKKRKRKKRLSLQIRT